jgi:hypothetical protein
MDNDPAEILLTQSGAPLFVPLRAGDRPYRLTNGQF